MNALTPFLSAWPFGRSRLGRDFADLFERMAEWEGSQLGSWNLFVDVIENPEAFVVKAELPGLEAKDINIALSGNTLTIQGEKKREEKKEGENFHLLERMEGSFSRTVRLASAVREDGVEALLKDGLLTITIAKAEPAKSHAIKVKHG